MYRSRFRSGRRSSDATTPESRTTIYTNRSNRYVIDRMLDTGYTRQKRTWQEEYEKNCQELTTLHNHRPPASTDISFFISQHQRLLRTRLLQKKISWFESGKYEEEWTIQTRRMYHRSDQQVARLVLCNNIMKRPIEYFFMNPDKCPDCITFYTFDIVTNVHTCPKCGYTVDTLFVSEDNSQDILVTRDPNVASGSGTKQGSGYTYVRSPLYRRYLGQFSEDVIAIPTNVMQVLYRYLSNIHLQNSIRCRPTPVGNILCAQGLAKWSNMSIRISKIFNGEPVPVLPVDLIERMVARFDAIFHEASRTKKKLPSFEFITHILLRIEGQPELAKSFALHKTRTVLRRIYDDLQQLIQAVQTTDTTLTWDNIPSF